MTLLIPVALIIVIAVVMIISLSFPVGEREEDEWDLFV